MNTGDLQAIDFSGELFIFQRAESVLLAVVNQRYHGICLQTLLYQRSTFNCRKRTRESWIGGLGGLLSRPDSSNIGRELVLSNF